MCVAIYMPRWNDVLIELYKMPEHRRYCQRLFRAVNASANHVRTIVQELEAKGLVEIIPTKKIKRIHMTEKGTRVALSMIDIQSELR